MDLGTAVGYLDLDTSGFIGGFSKAQQALKTFSDSSAALNDKLSASGQIMSSVGGTMSKYITTPLLGAATAAVGFADSANSAFNQFEARVGETTRSLEGYREVMDSIYANNYGESFEDVANSMADVVTYLGEMPADKMQSVTESAITLRDVFGYETAESLRSVDTLMQNFGLSAEEAFDYIVTGQQEGLDYSGEFLDTINEYSVQFQKLGFDANDMFNILKNGSENGAWNLDKIGDAIKEVSIRLVDGSDTTRHALETLGYDADKYMQIFSEGGEGAREAFLELVTQLNYTEDEFEKNTLGVELFGTMWEDLGPEVIKQMTDIKFEAIDMRGAMDELKEVKYDDLGSALQGLWRNIQLLAAEFGDVLIPKVESVIDFVGGLVDKFKGLDDGTKETIVNFGLVAAAIGPVLLVGGKLISGISSVISLLSGAGGALSALSGPIGIIVAAIAAFAVAWTTNFAGIRDTTQEVMNSIKEIIQSVWGFITELWESNFLGIKTIAENAWNTIKDLFEIAFDTIESLFSAFSALFRGDWDTLWQEVKNIFSNVWKAIGTLLEGFLDLIIGIILGIGTALWNAGKEAFNNVKEAFTEVWNNIKDWFEQAVNDPVGTIKGIGTDLLEAGKEIFTSLWDGMKNVWNSITSWVEDAVNWIVDKVKFWESEASKMNTSSIGGGGTSGSSGGGRHIAGLDYVPYTGYRATLEEGERVLTKQEAQNYGKTKAVSLVINNTFTQAVDKNMARKVSKQIARDTVAELRSKGVSVV